MFDVEEELQEEAESRRMSQIQTTRKGTASSRQSRKETKDETKLADKFTQQQNGDHQHLTTPAIRMPTLASEIVTPIASPKDVPEFASIASQVVSDSAAQTPPPPLPPALSSSQSSPVLSLHDRHLQRERERRKSQRRDRRPSISRLDTGNLLQGLLLAAGEQEYAPSPLARIFQPIVVTGPTGGGPNVTFDSADEAAIESGDEGHSSWDEDAGTAAGRSVSGGGRLQGGGGGPIPISFGPISRRISASRQKLSQIGSDIGIGLGAAGIRRRTQSAVGPHIRPGLLAPLTATPPMRSRSGSTSTHAHPFPVPHHSMEPETVTEIEGEDDNGGHTRELGEREWRDRLGQIEERQQRMEKMLERIADTLMSDVSGDRDGAARSQ